MITFTREKYELPVDKYVIDSVSSRINGQLDNAIIDGLKRKGYYFNSIDDIEIFIKSNCKSVHNASKGERIFYVNDIPFLLIKYNFDVKCKQDENGIGVSATAGTFEFL